VKTLWIRGHKIFIVECTPCPLTDMYTLMDVCRRNYCGYYEKREDGDYCLYITSGDFSMEKFFGFKKDRGKWKRRGY